MCMYRRDSTVASHSMYCNMGLLQTVAGSGATVSGTRGSGSGTVAGARRTALETGCSRTGTVCIAGTGVFETVPAGGAGTEAEKWSTNVKSSEKGFLM